MRKRGFTLIELLVVIAIITILASIVVPNVVNYLRRARMAKAVSEIQGINLALTRMLTDSGRSTFAQFFDGNRGDTLGRAGIKADSERFSGAVEMYNAVFYELLRRGKEATLDDYDLYLQESVRTKLGTSYMDVPKDPWGEFGYQFYAGPMKTANFVYFRCYRAPLGEEPVYVYDDDHKAYEDGKIRGNPRPDYHNGFPAPNDLPVYVWSMGENLISDQYVGINCDQSERNDGGDDINNWDNAGGWEAMY